MANRSKHKKLCPSACSKTSETGADQFHVILLPEDEELPRFVLVGSETYPGTIADYDYEGGYHGGPLPIDEDHGIPMFDIPDGPFQIPKFRPLFGKDMFGGDKGYYGTEPLVVGARGNGQHLDHTIHFGYKDNFMNDGSKPNKCLAGLLGADAGNDWRGPLVIYGLSKAVDAHAAADLHASDFSIALRALKARIVRNREKARRTNDGSRAAEMAAMGFEHFGMT